jgi:hypothetical protein
MCLVCCKHAWRGSDDWSGVGPAVEGHKDLDAYLRRETLKGVHGVAVGWLFCLVKMERECPMTIGAGRQGILSLVKKLILGCNYVKFFPRALERKAWSSEFASIEVWINFESY